MEGMEFERLEAAESKETAAGELTRVLEGVPSEENHSPDREQQKAIIGQLPENLVEELHGHLMAREEEQRRIAAERGKEFEPGDDRGVVRGELFERLVTAQYGRAGAEARDPRLVEELSQELVQLMHNPDRFGLGAEIGHIRNPDLAFFKINDQGKVEIEAAGEAKLGRLGERAADQIGRGFRQGVQKMVQAVNRLEKPEESGLAAVAQSRTRGGGLSAAEDFKVKLIVPADRNPEDKKSLVNRNDFRDQGYYYGFLRKLEKIEILKSAFSQEEVSRMADHLLGKIRERYPQPNSEVSAGL